MRLHDHLMTETPRPLLDDEVFTEYATLYGNATVIDITQVAALLMALTQFDHRVQEDLEDFGGDAHAWQMAQFFCFDWDTIQNAAPPFETMCLEFDAYEAAKQHWESTGGVWGPKERREMAHLGKTAVAMYYCPVDGFRKTADGHRFAAHDPEIQDILTQPDVAWVLTVTVFHYVGGKGLVGPQATWFIPVSKEGRLYTIPMKTNRTRGSLRGSDGKETLLAVLRNPHDPMEDFAIATGHVSDGKRMGVVTGWQAIIPALLAINFMHTPGGVTGEKGADRGYHEKVPGAGTLKEQKAFMRRHFVPMTRWYTLDISRLRAALTRANGGKHPDSLAGLQKALHTVRGNYAHYAPNTYFGRKHEEWITVFRPGHVRGDLAAGKIDKDYRVS